MKLHDTIFRRRLLIESALACGVGPAFGQQSAAGAEKTRKIVVPFHAGGISSIVASLLAQELFALGAGKYEIVHVPGMTNMLAYRAVKLRGRALQWDILIGGPSIFTIGQSLNPFLTGDPEKDLKILTPLLYGPMVLVTSSKSRIADWRQLEKKADPKKVAVSGLGSPSHLMAAYIDTSLFKLGQAFNTEGDIPAIHRVLAGELDCAVVSLGSCREFLNSDLNVLMSSMAEPLTLSHGQQVPSVRAIAKDRDAPDFSFYNWLGAAIDIHMPESEQATLMQAITEARHRPALQQFFESIQHQALLRSPEQMAQEIRQYADYWAEFVDRLKLEKALDLLPG